jgi:hypothetical protein
MKKLKYILMLVGTGALLAGCATSENQPAYGAMGNDTEIGTATSVNPQLATPPAPAGPVYNGANGSVSRSNPFGAGGTGMSTAN